MDTNYHYYKHATLIDLERLPAVLWDISTHKPRQTVVTCALPCGNYLARRPLGRYYIAGLEMFATRHPYNCAK